MQNELKNMYSSNECTVADEVDPYDELRNCNNDHSRSPISYINRSPCSVFKGGMLSEKQNHNTFQRSITSINHQT